MLINYINQEVRKLLREKNQRLKSTYILFIPAQVFTLKLI